ncbi:hypothetical protein Tco_1522745 [Tanacetum coccineum]
MSVSDGAGVLRIPEMYKTNALASSWGCPKTKLRREDEQRDIPKRVASTVLALYLYYGAWIPGLYLVFLSGVRCTLKTRSRETRNQEACLAVPENLPERLLVILPGDSSGECFGDLRRQVVFIKIMGAGEHLHKIVFMSGWSIEPPIDIWS